MELFKAIKLKMQSEGLTIRALEQESGIKYTTLSKFLTGKQAISADKLLSILSALDIDLIDNLRTSMSNNLEDSHTDQGASGFKDKLKLKFINDIMKGCR